MNNIEREPTTAPAPEKAEVVIENKIEQPLENIVENNLEKEKIEIENFLEGSQEKESEIEKAVTENENLAKTFWEKLSDHKHLEHKLHEHSPKIMAALHLGLEMATHNPQVAHAFIEHLELVEKQFGHIIFDRVSKGVATSADKIKGAWDNYKNIKLKKAGLQSAELPLS